MIRRKSLEARIKALEQRRPPDGRQFIINVRDGEEEGPHAMRLEEKLKKEHGLFSNKNDILLKIRRFTLDDEEFENISNEVNIKVIARRSR